MREDQHGAQTQRGFSRFELGVTACVFAILVAVLLQRVVFYQEQAELAAMERVVGTLRSALHLKVVNLFLGQRPGELAALINDNPMSWLARPPPNYQGEFFAPDVTELAHGSWYFDRRSMVLVYLFDPRNKLTGDGARMRKYKLTLQAPVNGAARGLDVTEGIALNDVYE